MDGSTLLDRESLDLLTSGEEVLRSVGFGFLSVCGEKNLSFRAWLRELGLRESFPGLVPGGKGMGFVSRRGSCL